MRFKGRIELEHGLKQIVIVPLMGTMLLLLIFFILISNFVIQQGINVKLPKAVTSKATGFNNLEVMISSKNELYVDGSKATREELRATLKELAPRNPIVMIKAEKSVALLQVTQIWEMCRELGIKQLNLAVNQE